MRDVPRPDADDLRVLAVAAGLLELFAQRAKQQPPDSTCSVEAATEPIFLVCAGGEWTRELCLVESPGPLKRRRLYATPNYLTFV